MERIAVLSVSYGSAIVLLNSELPSNKYLILLHAVRVNSTRIFSAAGPSIQWSRGLSSKRSGFGDVGVAGSNPVTYVSGTTVISYFFPLKHAGCELSTPIRRRLAKYGRTASVQT